MMLEATRSDGEPVSSPQADAFTSTCDAALREAAAALRESRAPQGGFRLRSGQRALVASLTENTDDAFTVTLRDASDRIVDAIDSLLHVLEARGN
jgi:hypothetical protein